MALQAINLVNGEVLKAGDPISDFRGNVAYFKRAVRGQTPGGRSGKIAVDWTGQNTSESEYYDKVFSVEVREV